MLSGFDSASTLSYMAVSRYDNVIDLIILLKNVALTILFFRWIASFFINFSLVSPKAKAKTSTNITNAMIYAPMFIATSVDYPDDSKLPVSCISLTKSPSFFFENFLIRNSGFRASKLIIFRNSVI